MKKKRLKNNTSNISTNKPKKVTPKYKVTSTKKRKATEQSVDPIDVDDDELGENVAAKVTKKPATKKKGKLK